MLHILSTFYKNRKVASNAPIKLVDGFRPKFEHMYMRIEMSKTAGYVIQRFDKNISQEQNKI